MAIGSCGSGKSDLNWGTGEVSVEQGLEDAGPNRTWLFPNRKLDLDCTKLNPKERLEMIAQGKHLGLLDGLPDRAPLAAESFKTEVDDLYLEGLQKCSIAWWENQDRPTEILIAFSWHKWRERMDRWESDVGLIVPWSHSWQKEAKGSAGPILYDTWLSPDEIERYWLNWIIRASGWFIKMNGINGWTEKSCPNFKEFNKLIGGLTKVMLWYDRQGIRGLDGLVWDPAIDWTFSWDEMMMRYEEYPTIYETLMHYKRKADMLGTRKDKRICNRLLNKMMVFTNATMVPLFNFISTDLRVYMSNASTPFGGSASP